MWARQQRAQELENLKAENATLKQRVLVLESAAAGQIADITLKVEEQLKEGPPSKILEGVNAFKYFLLDTRTIILLY